MHLCSHHHGIALTQHWYVLTSSGAHAEEGSLVLIHTIIQDISLDCSAIHKTVYPDFEAG